ncbi:hypothetical protein [Oleiharenicola lentus]|uniref:hypothetical protein n=1 Tax=Oleiharenicola lentus TaxID=2508720 RepID=UPI003F66482A
MKLSPEQKETVATWVAAGDNLSTVQKKLRDELKISMTYMDVRFLVDDLGLELKNPAPKADTSDVSKTPAPQPAAAPAADDDSHADENLPEGGAPPDEELPEDAGVAPDGTLPLATNVSLELDRIVRPGTVVSGTVTFTDGMTGNWGLDQYGRLMLDAATKGYKPSPTDIQAFQKELQVQLQKQGY